MRSLAEVDRDLDSLGVAAERLAQVRARAIEARPASLSAADEELEALGEGKAPPARAAQPRLADPTPVETHDVAHDVVDEPAAPEDRGSGLIEVSDEVLRSSDLPAVLALDGLDSDGSPEPAAPNAEIAGALSALALDLDSGETPIEMAPEPRRIESTAPPAMMASALEGASGEMGLDDPDADLGSLLGEADPLRDDPAATPEVGAGFDELEDEHTAMFTAADAARFSRPPPPDGASGEDFELDIEEVVLDDEELMEPAAVAAPRPPPGRTQPPPPPRTMPPEPPKNRPSEAPRGFLGKLLQRKP
jgi:hypothetical protein